MALRVRLRGPEGRQHTCSLGEAAELGDLVAEAARAFDIQESNIEVLLGFPPALCEADSDTPLTNLVRNGDAAMIRVRGASTASPPPVAPAPVAPAPPQPPSAAAPVPAFATPADPPRDRIATVQSSGSWSCALCTLVNLDSANVCDVCGEAKPSAPSIVGAPASASWSCSACTLINAAEAVECNACGGPAPSRGGAPTTAPPPSHSPTPSPPEPAVSSTHAAVSSAHAAVAPAKRAFLDKDPSDVLAQPVHGVAKRARGADPVVSNQVQMSEVEVRAMARAIFGDKPEATDVERWLVAGFNFSTAPGTEWGLWQQQGGPCGVFAPVQGFMLKHLLFGEAVDSARRERPLAKVNGDEDTRWSVLAYALATVLFHATPSSSYCVCQVSCVAGDGAAGAAAAMLANGACGLTVTIQRVSRITEVQQLFEDAGSSWLIGPGGVLSFVASVVVSRGLERLSDDADDPGTPLIGAFGHCSQELVNLMLIGEATSNVFDGGRWLGDDPACGMLLKGVDGDKVGVPQIGYLSEMEAMRYLVVGTLYKHPDFPIWVLGSPTHYTVLFSTRRSDSQLSEGAALEQQAKKVFADNSVDDGGIAMSANLGKMLDALDIPSTRQSSAQADLVKEDIVLWMDFLSWVRKAKGIADTPAAANGRLNLFLYDGQDPPGPNMRRVTVELTDVDPLWAAGGDADAFSATLHTRWPNAVVTIGQ